MMGTNYYLHYLEDCSQCGRRPAVLHIGKSSAGWPWTWRGYQDVPGLVLRDSHDWLAFLVVEVAVRNAVIKGEYGGAHDLTRLVRHIVRKRGDRHTAERGEAEVTSDGDHVLFCEFS